MKRLASGDFSRYDDFPVVGVSPQAAPARGDLEVSFSGLRHNYCICYIDMMNSTRVTAQLNDEKMGLYYSAFLNPMATIAKNFGARIIKNAGDCLIFYFPATSEPDNLPAFRNVIECAITMMAAHRPINARLQAQKLPSMDFRISADYGLVELAKSAASQSDDLFGSMMNLCAKINSRAPANGMIIGSGLHKMLYSFSEYCFEPAGEYAIGAQDHYALYLVKSKERRNILDPFSRKSSDGALPAKRRKLTFS